MLLSLAQTDWKSLFRAGPCGGDAMRFHPVYLTDSLQAEFSPTRVGVRIAKEIFLRIA
jgi:hypothetical protein